MSVTTRTTGDACGPTTWRRRIAVPIVALLWALGGLGIPGVLAAGTGDMPEQAQEANPDPAAIGRGAQAWSQHCNRCHNMRDPRELRDFEWEVSVMHMRQIGNLPGEMARDIKAYLKEAN